MQWLLHAPVPAAALELHGHKTHPPEELALPAEATLEDLLKAAHGRQWDILTADATLAMLPFQKRAPFSRSIVYLQLSGGEAELAEGVNRLFVRYPRLTPGRLYTVTGSRVKVRQLPGGGSGL
jgi:hypothetical protein